MRVFCTIFWNKHLQIFRQAGRQVKKRNEWKKKGKERRKKEGGQEEKRKERKERGREGGKEEGKNPFITAPNPNESFGSWN